MSENTETKEVPVALLAQALEELSRIKGHSQEARQAASIIFARRS